MTITKPPAPAYVALGWDDNQYHIMDAFGTSWCDDYDQEFGTAEPANLVLTRKNICDVGCLEALRDEGYVKEDE